MEAGRQRVRQNIAGYLPQVSGDASAARRKRSAAQTTGLPGSGGGASSWLPSTTTRPRFSLSQVLFDFGRNLDAIQAAQARDDSLAADADTQRETIVRDVKQAYFDLLAARRLRGVAEEVLRSNQRQLEQARGRYEVGFATKLDVTRSEVLVANAELDLLTARNAVLVAEQTLRNAMGLTEPLDFEPVDVLEATAVEIEEAARARDRARESARARLGPGPAPRRRGGRLGALEGAPARPRRAARTIDWSGTSSPLRDSWNLAAIVNVPIFSGGLIDARVGEARANALALSASRSSR